VLSVVIAPGGVVRGRYKPIVITAIIVINTLVYIYTSLASDTPLLSSSSENIYKYGFIPYLLFSNLQEALYRIFTSMFIHADLIHIFFNMYFLWIFGSRLEGLIGHFKTLLLYIVSGISAVLFHVAFIPIGGYSALAIPAVGASGAISGILGAYLLMLPHTRLVMCMFFFFIPYCFKLSAEAFMIIWFIQQVIYGYLRLGGVAYFAHVGGFVMGLLLTPLLLRHVMRPEIPLNVFRYLEHLLGIFLPRPRGVSPLAKVILVLLLIAISGGFLYAALNTRDATVYLSSVEVNDQGDYVVFAITPREVVASSSLQEDVRILINRLINTPYVYNVEYANRVENIVAQYYVNVLGVRVPVSINMLAKYDELGVLVESHGTMNTVSVIVSPSGVAIGTNKTLKFNLSSNRVASGHDISGICLIAAGISILAVISVVKSRGIFSLYIHEEIPTPYL
jgi:membrane associated rhomboid family serine protease